MKTSCCFLPPVSVNAHGTLPFLSTAHTLKCISVAASATTTNEEDKRSSNVIMVPGKFDSFHIGHRHLAQTASNIGVPTLISFSGMSTSLNWKPRLPVVAPIERDRILRQWSLEIGVSIQYQLIPFEQIRNMSPEQFLSYLKSRFNASGIVCGNDWRFGKRRAGDVTLLKQLSADYDLDVNIINPVPIPEHGFVVSSTRVRQSLADGHVKVTSKLLGRLHRIVGFTLFVDDYDGSVICGDFINMIPASNTTYNSMVRVLGKGEAVKTTVLVFEKDNETFVRVHNAQDIYCINCEIYIDFID